MLHLRHENGGALMAGFIIGLAVGAALGVFCMALLSSASAADDKMGEAGNPLLGRKTQ